MLIFQFVKIIDKRLYMAVVKIDFLISRKKSITTILFSSSKFVSIYTEELFVSVLLTVIHVVLTSVI